jgi:hypothetical protein
MALGANLLTPEYSSLKVLVLLIKLGDKNMLVNTKKMVIAWSIAAALMWAVCSALVALSPGSMTTMTGHMMHMDLGHTSLSMSLTGFVVGLIGWTVLAAGFAWLFGAIYNYAGSPDKTN